MAKTLGERAPVTRATVQDVLPPARALRHAGRPHNGTSAPCRAFLLFVTSEDIAEGLDRPPGGSAIPVGGRAAIRWAVARRAACPVVRLSPELTHENALLLNPVLGLSNV
ncbi:hypothetical protein [Streptomyces sp. NPDC001500]